MGLAGERKSWESGRGGLKGERRDSNFGYPMCAPLSTNIPVSRQCFALPGARILYVAAQPRAQRQLYAAAYNSKLLYGSGYGWLSAWLSEDALRSDVGDIDGDAARGAEGVVGLIEAVDTETSEHQRYLQRWKEASSRLACEGLVEGSKKYCDADGDYTTIPGYSAQQVDAVVAFSSVLDGLLREGVKAPSPDDVYQAVLKIDGLKGISGSVSFESSSGDRLGVLDIRNLQILHNDRRKLSTFPRRASRAPPPLARLIPSLRRSLFVPLSSSRADFVNIGHWSPVGKMQLVVSSPVIFPGRLTNPPSDSPPPEEVSGVGLALGLTVGLLLFVAILVFIWQRRLNQRKLRGLREQLHQFQESIIGVRSAEHDYDPRDAQATRSETDKDGRVAISETGAMETSESRGSTTKPTDGVSNALWYWLEDDDMIGAHACSAVIANNYVAYSWSVTLELEHLYTEFLLGAGPEEVDIDLTDRIASTGNEAKAQKAETGCQFRINFRHMTQTNVKSRYTRKVLRQVQEKQNEAKDDDLRSRMKTKSSMLARRSLQSTENLAGMKPSDLEGEDELILRKGQLLQTSKQRSDGWAYGSVIHDEAERPPVGVDGLSTQAGWFPLSLTCLPTPAQLEALQAKMGAGALDALQTPETWSKVHSISDPSLPFRSISASNHNHQRTKRTLHPSTPFEIHCPIPMHLTLPSLADKPRSPQVKDPLESQLFLLPNSPEKDRVIDAFKNSSNGLVVVSVERIQNYSMWQSYAVKRQTVLQREKDVMTSTKVKRASCMITQVVTLSSTPAHLHRR